MSRVDPLAGKVVAGVSATALSSYPRPIPGVRELARQLDATPGGVSLAVRRLVSAGLLTRTHRAAVPKMFDEAARNWAPTWVACSTVPEPEDGLVAVGTLAAAHVGAPVAARDQTPVELLATTDSQLRRIRRTQAPLFANTIPAALVALAPSPVFTIPSDLEAEVAGHLAAHQVIVALTIALDEGRGREILDNWNVDDRVW